MDEVINFLKSAHILALIIPFLIFLLTIFLVIRRWIGFSITLLFLLFALAAGMVINNQEAFQQYLTARSVPSHTSPEVESQETFRIQMIQAVEDLKIEVHAEKENLNQVVNQVQSIVNSIELQKQKLQQFIEETRDRFKTEYAPKAAISDSEPASH